MTSHAATLGTLSARKVVNRIQFLFYYIEFNHLHILTVHIAQSTTATPVTKAPITESPVTSAPATEDPVHSQCEIEKTALNSKIGLLSSVLQSKMAEIKELLNQNEKKTAELNEYREKIQRLEMINNITGP